MDLFFILVILSLFNFAQTQTEANEYHQKFDQEKSVCPQNEVFESCITPSCELECGDSEWYLRFCPPGCKSGCHCDPKQFRRWNGTCIPKKDCPEIVLFDRCAPFYKYECQDNEEYSECKKCEHHCNGSVICNNHTGCFCDAKYYRRLDRSCVDVEKCPPYVQGKPVCPQNEVYESCKIPSCELQCGEYINWLENCPKECRSGCHCDPKKYRRWNRACIPKEDCPYPVASDRCAPFSPFSIYFAGCRRNEILSTCKECERHCNGSVICNNHTGCFCHPKRYRRLERSCVEVEECPLYVQGKPVCPQNEVYESCVTPPCELKCGDSVQELNICRGICKSGCHCDPKKFRRWNGTCIPKEDCPAYMQCPQATEKYSECHRCERSCGEGNEHEKCSSACYKGCFCDDDIGLRRDPEGRCIRTFECPKKREGNDLGYH